ncbi:MAG: TadE/TadG family type IV pilus assembly protein [Candidatus Dormibacteria bacterium]
MIAIHRRGQRGQALVELAIVLPVLLLLGCGAVAVVQLARTQMALGAVSSAAALVGARGVDALQACQQAHQELTTGLQESGGLLPAGQFRDLLRGGCVGSPPNTGSMPSSPGKGSYALWFGLGGTNTTFCRRGGSGTPSDGAVTAAISFRPNLDWIPLLGDWMSPRLTASSAQKIDPFRSRDPSQDPTGDDC